jgi:hypothetical protein
MTSAKHPPTEHTPRVQSANGKSKGAAADNTALQSTDSFNGVPTGTFTNAQSGLNTSSDATPGMTKTVAQVLGEITWLMTQSAGHKSFFIGDLEWMVMTPILMQQFRMFYEKDKPIGVVL